jgi:hypothetical protein
MAKSLNGWTAIKKSSDNSLRSITIPGTKRVIKVHEESAPLFASFFADWQREMPDRMNLNPGPTDGWNYRESRAIKSLSNHASGTAVDVLYSSVLPADGKPHMTKTEKEILDKILGRYVTGDGHRVLANGEWWNPPNCDGMHTELSQSWDRGARRNTNVEDVREVIKRLNIDHDGNRPLGFWDGVVPLYENIIMAEKNNVANDAAWRLASRLADLGFFKGLPVRGVQRYPKKAVADWQASIGAQATGIYGPIAQEKLFSK